MAISEIHCSFKEGGTIRRVGFEKWRSEQPLRETATAQISNLSLMFFKQVESGLKSSRLVEFESHRENYTRLIFFVADIKPLTSGQIILALIIKIV